MLIALSGFKGSGKDTAAQVLIDEYGFTRLSFADALRDGLLALDPLVEMPNFESVIYGGQKVTSYIATPLSEVIESYGWDKAKREIPEVRRLMQVFGTEVGRMLFGEDVWIKVLVRKHTDIAHKDARYVITDCRFENEATFVKSAFGSICWIDRPGLQSDGHASESDVVKDYADNLITNDSSLADLQEDMRFLMHLKGVDSIVRS